MLGFDPDENFEVADAVLAHSREVVDRGQEAHAEWQKTLRRVGGREPERWSCSTG